MSVTFYADLTAIPAGFVTSCYTYGSESDYRSAVDFSVDDAVARHNRDHGTDCAEDHMVQSAYEPTGVDELNMSNTNAAAVLAELGYTGEALQAGRAPAKAFADACRRDAVTACAASTATTVSHAYGRPMMVNCGRPDGYLAAQLQQLAYIADGAHARHADIIWS